MKEGNYTRQAIKILEGFLTIQPKDLAKLLKITPEKAGSILRNIGWIRTFNHGTQCAYYNKPETGLRYKTTPIKAVML